MAAGHGLSLTWVIIAINLWVTKRERWQSYVSNA